ncbi:MAG: substrate-binding domain-containing protein [Pseudomonadota bacterium]
MTKQIGVCLLMFLLTVGAGMAIAGEVLVVTPWMDEPGTQLMVDALDKSAAKRGWRSRVVQDLADFEPHLQELVDANRAPLAIVVNVAPNRIQAGLEVARRAGIPVIGMDAENSPLLLTNVSSNSYSMAAETASYLTDRLSDGGEVLIITYDEYAPVQKRGVVAEAIFANTEGLSVAGVVNPDVRAGSFASAKAQVAKFLMEHPEPSTVKAIWSAWDEAGLGALAAVEALDRQSEGILITGIDATEKARAAVARGGNFIATVEQDFPEIGRQVVRLVQRQLDGDADIQSVYYIPARLVTAETAAAS